MCVWYVYVRGAHVGHKTTFGSQFFHLVFEAGSFSPSYSQLAGWQASGEFSFLCLPSLSRSSGITETYYVQLFTWSPELTLAHQAFTARPFACWTISLDPSHRLFDGKFPSNEWLSNLHRKQLVYPQHTHCYCTGEHIAWPVILLNTGSTVEEDYCWWAFPPPPPPAACLASSQCFIKLIICNKYSLT